MKGQVARYAVVSVLALALLVGVMLLVRPLIFSVAGPRDDSVYAVGPTGSISATAPLVEELLLNTPHRLLGERPNGPHAAITVVVSRTLTGLYSVVNAWSPVSNCAVTVREDRLVDCRAHAWTFTGDPFATADPPLQRFPVTSENGAVVVDFTHPLDAAR